jgi:hypothetical protein
LIRDSLVVGYDERPSNLLKVPGSSFGVWHFDVKWREKSIYYKPLMK